MLPLLTALQSAPKPFAPKASPLGSRRRVRLIENFQMESATLRPAAWTYPAQAPVGRGDNLSDTALAEATKRLNAHPTVRSPGLHYSSLLARAGEALNPLTPTGCDFFFRVASSATGLTGTIWNVCSVRALRYSFPSSGVASLKAVHDWMTSADPAILPVQPNGGQVGLCRIGGAFWLSDESPLDLLNSRGIPIGTELAARTLLQELALPGFETQARRQDAMGLVAIEFPASCLTDVGLSARAWKPTAIDALNYKGYCFLPGRALDSHGLTWPLKKCLRRHDSRDGLREFVHPHISVPALAGGRRMVHLLGFLDAAAEAAWKSLTPP